MKSKEVSAVGSSSDGHEKYELITWIGQYRRWCRRCPGCGRAMGGGNSYHLMFRPAEHPRSRLRWCPQCVGFVSSEESEGR